MNSKGEAYKFYISHEEPEFAKLTKLADTHGGEVYDVISELDVAKGEAHLKQIIPIASSRDHVRDLTNIKINRFFRPEFILKSVENGTTLKLEEFEELIDPEVTDLPQDQLLIPQLIEKYSNAEVSLDSEIRRTMSKNPFTFEEDLYIIALARKNPKSVDSKFFFEAVQRKLANHTVASLRSRYRKKLKEEVKFFYKVTSDGRIVKDANGEYILDKTGHQKGLKSYYTPKDDYFLCKKLSEQNIGPSSTNPEQMVVVSYTTTNFFSYMASKYPSHSLQSWRDRYRKFAVVKGIVDYVQYFERASVMGVELVNLNSFNSELKKQVDTDYDKFVELKKQLNEQIPTFTPPEQDDTSMDEDLDKEDIKDEEIILKEFLYESKDEHGKEFGFVDHQGYSDVTSKKRGPMKRPILNLSPIGSPELKLELAQLRNSSLRPLKRQKITTPYRIASKFPIVMDKNVENKKIPEQPVFETKKEVLDKDDEETGEVREEIFESLPIENDSIEPY